MFQGVLFLEKKCIFIQVLLYFRDFKGNNMMFRKTQSDDESLHFVAVDLQVATTFFKCKFQTLVNILQHFFVWLQGTRYDTPAMDLSVYLFTTVKPSVRQTRLHELLEIYRLSLNEISEKLKYPINLTSEVIWTIRETTQMHIKLWLRTIVHSLGNRSFLGYTSVNANFHFGTLWHLSDRVCLFSKK